MEKKEQENANNQLIAEFMGWYHLWLLIRTFHVDDVIHDMDLVKK